MKAILLGLTSTAQKMKFFIKDFFSKCGQIRSFLWIWSYLLKKSLMENFIFLHSARCSKNEPRLKKFFFSFHYMTKKCTRSINELKAD